jgi:hypothetical protein
MRAMKKLFILSLFWVSVSGFAQEGGRLSNQADISVITCGPYQGELYSAFGHSAFRVHDPAAHLDKVYNYGTFDFDQPNFYLNFTRGHLLYKLSAYDYQHFQNSYIYYNRFIHEQILNLTPAQKQRLFDYLEWNTLPENESYYYDYFYNNCATKIRDVVATVFGDSVKFDGSYITNSSTIRNLTDVYLEPQPWGDLGIDICLGLPMDKTATPYEHMFLPDFIESGFDHATIQQNNTVVPIVKVKNMVYESRNEPQVRGFFHPLFFFLTIAVLVAGLSVYDVRRGKASAWFDAILFSITGLIGILLLFLWLGTDHKAAANNMNLLWAFPFNLVAAIALIRNPRWLEKYFFAIAVLSALLLVSWFWLPQMLNHFLVPIVVIIMVRAFIQWQLRSKAVKS